MEYKHKSSHITRTNPASRSSNGYTDLNASSPLGVTILPKKYRGEVEKWEGEINNDRRYKVDMTLPPIDLKLKLPDEIKPHRQCICMRPLIANECGRCHQFIHGRLAQICYKHPLKAFIPGDILKCPYCKASTLMIKPSHLTWEQIRKFEEAPLPDDNDIWDWANRFSIWKLLISTLAKCFYIFFYFKYI